MSKRKGARQGPRPAKLTVVNRGLNLFSQPPTDDSIFGIEPHKYYPDTDSVTPVEFTLKKPDSWTKLRDSYIYFFAGLVKTGGAIGDDKVGMVQNMAFSVFSHIEIKINGRQVNMPTPKSFAMVQWLRAFLNMSDDDKKTWGTLQGYMPIDSGSDASGDPNFAHRKIFTASDDGSGSPGYLGDQPFYLPLGQIPAFDTDEFISPQVKINFRLYPFNSNWPLISDGVDNYKVVVKATPKPYLVAYHPLINPKYAFPLERTLASASTPACYTLQNITLRDFNIPDGLSMHRISNVVPEGPMPERILVALQPQQYFEKPNTTAGRKLNPFTFPLCNLTKLETNGSGGFDEINLKEEPSEPYRRFIQQFQQTGTGIRLTAPQFYAKYNLYIFDFTPSTEPTDPTLYKLPRGTQNFTFHFNPASATNTKALFFLFYRSVLHLDMLGSVMFDDTAESWTCPLCGLNRFVPSWSPTLTRDPSSETCMPPTSSPPRTN